MVASINKLMICDSGLVSGVKGINQFSENKMGKVISELGLLKMNIDFSKMGNKDVKVLFKLVKSQIDDNLNLKMINHSKEELLVEFMSAMGILSYMSALIYDSEEQDYNIDPGYGYQHAIINTGKVLREANRSNVIDARTSLGELNATLELGINVVLARDNYSKMNSGSSMEDIEEILVLLNAKVILNQTYEAVLMADEVTKKHFMLSKEYGIQIPNEINTAFSKYIVDSKHEILKIQNEYSDEIFNAFKKGKSYSPDEIIDYWMSDEKAVKTDNILSIIPKKLLRLDMKCGKYIEENGITNAINDFVLNSNDFKKAVNPENLIGDNNRRLLRSPIIETESYYLLSPATWMSACKTLKLRILNRDIKIKNVGNFNELVKAKYDEYYLKKIQSTLASNGIRANTHFDMSKHKEIKDYFESKKKVPHEIDLYYMKNDTLYIWDLKNYKLQHSFKEIRKLDNNIREEKRKLYNLGNIIEENIGDFNKEFQIRFTRVKMGILTVDLTTYNYFSEKDSEIPVRYKGDFLNKAVF